MCIIIILITIFALWLFFGGGNYECVGLKPLQVNQEITPYILDNNTNLHLQDIDELFDRSPWSYEGIALTGGLGSVDEEEIDTSPILPPNFKSSKNNKEVQSKRFESKGEAKCREVMREIYEKDFPNKRPYFLKNPETNRCMELDCYNEELKIAVEYNGIQHYVYPNFTNQTYDEFIQQRRRDMLKVNLCDLNDVYLITVPYNVKLDQIYDYIVYYLPENVYQRKIQEINYHNKTYCYSSSEEE